MIGGNPMLEKYPTVPAIEKTYTFNQPWAKRMIPK
jgi:hypothetical protein